MPQPPGPSRQVQIAHIATEHFVNRKTRVEISNETGLSRFKVGRILDEALESGIVRIQIASPSGVRLDLSLQLRDRYQLDHVVVVDVPSESEEALQEALGAAAAELLNEILKEDDVLGLTSGRTLNAMARHLDTLACRRVVQLAGVAGPILQSGLESLRRVSMIEGVRPFPIYSSLVMSDAQAAEGVRRQPDVRRTFEQFDRVTVAVGAVGSWVPANSMLLENRALTEQDRKNLIDRGVVGEIAAALVTDAGEIVHDIDDRCIAISVEQLRRIRAVIAAAGGISKTRAIRAVLTSGLLSGLITDSATALRLLAT